MDKDSMAAIDLPERVDVVEVGPRDGLQFLDQEISTRQKVQMIDRLIRAGVPTVEAAAFVHPRAVPQMADAEDVIAGITREEGVKIRGFVPNVRGAERALETDVDEVTALVSCDDEFNQRNQNMSIDETLEQIARIRDLVGEAGVELIVIVALAFFTPGKGITPRSTMLTLTRRLIDLGVRRLQLAISMGMADPVRVYDRVSAVRAQGDDLTLGLHLHNRNGFALANLLAGLQAGVSNCETSVLGLGGDVLFPGSLDVMGNTPTEDVLHFLDCMNVDSGMSLETYLEAVLDVEDILGLESRAYVCRGGSRDQLSQPRYKTREGLMDS